MAVKDLPFLLPQLKAACEAMHLTGIMLGSAAPTLLFSDLTGCGNPGNHLAALLVPTYSSLVHVLEAAKCCERVHEMLPWILSLVLFRGTVDVWQQNTLYLTFSYLNSFTGHIFTFQ